MNTPTAREEADATRSLINVKATGIDPFHAEMFKVDLPTSVGVFVPFSMKCWNENKYQKIGGRV